MKLCIAIIALAPILSFSAVTEIVSKNQIEIVTPTLKEQKVAKIRLENGLTAYLISDPKTPQSAAALSVNAGSWDDAQEYAGIAHFLEHMLFMGTDSHPNPSEYMKFINDNGGAPNAYTAQDRTVYTFSINNSAFPEAFERLSEFFVSPHFDQHSVDGELKNVDHEFEKDKNIDGWRQLMVLQETANPDHPMSKFTIGNKETLGKIPRQALVDWWKAHYSADRMYLVAISNLSLEEMKEKTDYFFGKIEKRQISPSIYPDEMLSAGQKGSQLIIKPLKDGASIGFLWEMPKELSDLSALQSMNLINYCLNAQGEKSLTRVLKTQGLIEDFSTSSYLFSRNKMLVSMDFALTNKGLKKREYILSLLFSTLRSLKEEGIAPTLFEELQQQSITNYRYQERQNPFSWTTDMAADLTYYPIENFPESTNTLSEKFNPEKIATLLNFLTPEKGVLLFQTKETEGITFDKTEQYMKIPYTQKPLPVLEIKKENSIAAIPKANPYIARDFTLVQEAAQEVPVLLEKSDSTELYYMADTLFGVPQIAFQLEILSPFFNGSAKSLVLGNLYALALRENLAEELFFASYAKRGVNFGPGPRSFNIYLNGFSDKSSDLLIDLLKKKPKLSKDLFTSIKENFLRDVENMSKNPTLSQAHQIYGNFLDPYNPPVEEIIKELKAVSFEDFNKIEPFKQAYIKGVLYGNVSEKLAIQTMGKIKETLKAKPYPLSMQLPSKVLVLDKERGPYLFEKKSEIEGQATLLSIGCGAFDLNKKAALLVASTAFSHDFFETLREKQQTGYIAYSTAQEKEEELFTLFAVQSATHQTKELLARFNLFLEDYLTNLKTKIDENRFNSIKDSLLEQLKQPAATMDEKVDELFGQAFIRKGNFAFKKDVINALQKLSKEELYAFMQDVFSRGNRARLAVLVDGSLPKENDVDYKPLKKNEIPGSYKSAAN